MSSELAIDDSEAILYVRVLSDDIVKVDGDRHAYLLDKNFNIIYCHYNIGKFPWGAILNGNYYYINDINEIVKVNFHRQCPIRTPLYFCRSRFCRSMKTKSSFRCSAVMPSSRRANSSRTGSGGAGSSPSRSLTVQPRYWASICTRSTDG